MAKTRSIRMQAEFRERTGMTSFLSILTLLIPAIPYLLGMTSGNTNSVEGVEVQESETDFDGGSNSKSAKLNSSRDPVLPASSFSLGCSKNWGMTAYLGQLLGSGGFIWYYPSKEW